MNFSEKLQEYMNLLDIKTNELCKESGLSYMLINRYLNNIRKPKEDSKYFNKVVEGIYQISKKKNINLIKEDIYTNLQKALTADTFQIDYNFFIENFNLIQEELSLTTIEISNATGYDSSFISRMKNKERKPADFEAFIDKLRNYIFSVCQNNEKKNKIASILKCSTNELNDSEKFKEIFTVWLCSKHIDNKNDSILTFLTKLDNFDLNHYINTDFSKIKVPTVPVVFKSSKTYFGIEGRKQAEGEFLKTTLLSKSTEPIFFYSDLPISKAGEDENFKKKWVYAMSVLLKRGLHLNMVHNLDRSMSELLLGLENWIPIYMTGSITPYFFKTPPSNFFTGSECTSGSIALTSECIKNNENKSKFYLTTKKDEVNFEKEKSKFMLSKATPLMTIYKENDNAKFEEFMEKNRNENIQKIKNATFKNIDFCINENKWIMINKENTPKIHFIIYHEKLNNAIKTFLKL